MMAATHALVGVTIASFAAGTADPLHLAAAAISSQLPDVDTTRSLAGRLLLPLSRAIERRFPHRTVTHSLLATVLFAALSSPLCLHSQQAWKAALWGYLCGWFADAFTKSGVAAFYPLSAARLVVPANPRLRLSSGSRAERGVAVVFLCLLAAAVHFHTQGGLMRAFGSWMGQPEAVAALFGREGA
ncbi:MAG TPA: metal-dependent hydrolase, partial [Blastocatellia bacterium]|nr:metal-dependent hydrolase [Blastocatellia bacterium]